MKKDDFKRLYYSILGQAIAAAEKVIDRKLPRGIQVILHGPEHPGVLLDPDAAFEAIWLGEDEFYLIIDIWVAGLSATHTKVTARVSGHEPSSFERTWSDPPGNGPFKILTAEGLKDL